MRSGNDLETSNSEFNFWLTVSHNEHGVCSFKVIFTLISCYEVYLAQSLTQEHCQITLQTTDPRFPLGPWYVYTVPEQKRLLWSHYLSDRLCGLLLMSFCETMPCPGCSLSSHTSLDSSVSLLLSPLGEINSWLRHLVLVRVSEGSCDSSELTQPCLYLSSLSEAWLLFLTSAMQWVTVSPFHCLVSLANEVCHIRVSQDFEMQHPMQFFHCHHFVAGLLAGSWKLKHEAALYWMGPFVHQEQYCVFLLAVAF